MQYHTTTRRRLYELVWQRPMSSLSRELGISGVGLAKVCRKHCIPYPSRGYWTRRRFGKETAQFPLWNPEHDCRIRFATEHRSRNREMHDLLIRQLQEAVSVPTNLSEAHELVRIASTEFRWAAKDIHQRRIPPFQATLDITVSEFCFERSLLIMSGLLDSLTRFEVQKGPCVRLLGRRVRFGIREHIDRVAVAGSRQAASSGRLELFVGADCCGWQGRRRWTERKGESIEQLLRESLAGMVLFAAHSRERPAFR